MDIKVINGIRNLAIDMINECGSGNAGECLGIAPTMYTLFSSHLNFNKDDTNWLNRDRFILGSNNASAILYSTLFYSGYNITLEDLKSYGKGNGRLGINATMDKSIGVEITTGLSGEGFASAVGVAIGEAYISELLGKDLVNYYVYTLLTPMEMMEGITYETASFAGSLKLGKLIVLYDASEVTRDAKIKGIFDEDVLKRFEAMGWHTQVVLNGEDFASIDRAILQAKNETSKPSIIEIRTICGIGTSVSNTPKATMPLSDADLINVKGKMNLTQVPFHVSREAVTYFREKIDGRVSEKYNNWAKLYNKVLEKDANKKKLINLIEEGNISLDLKKLNVNFDKTLKEDMRKTNSNLMEVIADLFPLFIGGSADTSFDNYTYLVKSKDFKIDNKSGRNIRFGLRENLMSNVLNGLALVGLRPFGSTYLSKSDNMKSGIRLSSIMNLPVTYIFTHDSFKSSDNGILNMPTEQLSMIRQVPNMVLFRPADVNELVGSWDYILNKKVPASLVLPSLEKEMISTSSLDGTLRGAYIIKQERGRLQGVIISSGSEVSVSLEISDMLDRRGLYTRVISMPSIEVFLNSSEEYKRELLPMGSKVIVIEASNDALWNNFVYSSKYILNINKFGINAKSNEVLKYMEYDYEHLLEKCEKLLK